MTQNPSNRDLDPRTSTATDGGRSPAHASRSRRLWMFHVASAFQDAACRILLAEHPREALARVVNCVPPPRTRVEQLVLYGMLLESAVKAAGHTNGSAEYVANHGLDLLFPAARAARSIDAQDKALRAAQFIIDHHAARCDMPKVAHAVACHPTALRTLFRQYFGMTIREYHGRVRVCETVRQFATGTTNVLAVARSIGYRSEKNFYRAVSTFTGITPAELRDAKLPCVPERCGRLCPKSRTSPNVSWCAAHRIRSTRVA